MLILSACDQPGGSFCVQDLGGSVPKGMSMERAERWAAVGDHTCLMKLTPVDPIGLAELLARLPPNESMGPQDRCPNPGRDRWFRSEIAPWWTESQAPSVNEFYAGDREQTGGGGRDFWHICVDRTRDAIYILSGNT